MEERHPVVGVGQAGCRWQLLEQVDGVDPDASRLAGLCPGHHRQAGQLADRRALLQAIAERACTSAADRSAAIASSPPGRSGSTRPSTPCRSDARCAGVIPTAYAKRSPVLARGLPVRAERGRPAQRREERIAAPQGASPAASAWCASRARSCSSAGRASSSASAARCSSTPNCGRHRILDCQAGELVSEAKHAVRGCQHSGGEGVGEQLSSRTCKRCEQAGVSAGREDGQGVEKQSCVGAEPRGTGEHGISNGLGHLIGSVASTSVTKKGFPEVSRYSSSASAENGSARTPTAPRESGRTLTRRMPGTVAMLPRTTRRGSSLPSSLSRYVTTNKPSKPFDPAGDETNDVERGLVCPVDIFQQDDRREDRRELVDISASAKLYGFDPLRTRSSGVSAHRPARRRQTVPAAAA